MKTYWVILKYIISHIYGIDVFVKGLSAVIIVKTNAKGYVGFGLNGTMYAENIVDGKAIFQLDNLIPSTYTTNVNLVGAKGWGDATAELSFTISPINPLGDVTYVVSKDNGTIVIPFLKDATGEVFIRFGDKLYIAKIIDGKIIFDPDLPNGQYNATVIYLGDAKYSSSSTPIAIFIMKTVVGANNQKSTVKKTSEITAKMKTFKKSTKIKKYGVVLKSGKKPISNVWLTINVGKKTFKAKTNVKGKATFKITKLAKKGTFNVVVKFSGNKYFNAKTVKSKIIVK